MSLADNGTTLGFSSRITEILSSMQRWKLCIEYSFHKDVSDMEIRIDLEDKIIVI
jgi:hypothetical protein